MRVVRQTSLVPIQAARPLGAESAESTRAHLTSPTVYFVDHDLVAGTGVDYLVTPRQGQNESNSNRDNQNAKR